jgi:hypothetical protein
VGLELAFPGTIIHFVHIPNVAYVQTVCTLHILCIDDPRFFFYINCFPKRTESSPGGREPGEGYAAEKEATKL